MFSVLFLRYITGYVFFTAAGGFPERFINLCKAKHIRIWNVSFDEKSLSGYVRSRDYFYLRAIARTSGMVLRAKEKHGLVFFAKRNRSRIGLLISAAFFSALMFVLSLFIWSIEVTGNEKISDDKILSAVNNCGLHIGSFTSAVNTEELSQNVLNELNGKIMWIAVNINGSRAVVEVRDYIDKDEDETYKDPCNVVADFDGLLLSIEVHSGKKANVEGNGVKKGDLLISGIVEDRYFASHFYEARGVITALHSDKTAIEGNSFESLKKYSGEKSVYYLNIFSFSVPLGFFPKKGDCDEYVKIKNLFINGIELPLGITKKTRVYYGKNENADMQKLIMDNFTSLCYEKYKNTTVLSQELKFSEKKEKLSISQQSSCIDYMGKQQKINLSDDDEPPIKKGENAAQ